MWKIDKGLTIATTIILNKLKKSLSNGVCRRQGGHETKWKSEKLQHKKCHKALITTTSSRLSCDFCHCHSDESLKVCFFYCTTARGCSLWAWVGASVEMKNKLKSQSKIDVNYFAEKWGDEGVINGNVGISNLNIKNYHPFIKLEKYSSFSLLPSKFSGGKWLRMIKVFFLLFSSFSSPVHHT